MGEVYRAHDSKLGRDVAIKTLPQAFADHPERLARFRREARTLASLNHPNIAAIYGLEEPGGVTCLVLELVEGKKTSVTQVAPTSAQRPSYRGLSSTTFREAFGNEGRTWIIAILSLPSR